MKALGLLSGGLDSKLAVKMILDQGTSVEAITFVTLSANAAKVVVVHLRLQKLQYSFKGRKHWSSLSPDGKKPQIWVW